MSSGFGKKTPLPLGSGTGGKKLKRNGTDASMSDKFATLGVESASKKRKTEKRKLNMEGN
jgi:hypothetical protein